MRKTYIFGSLQLVAQLNENTKEFFLDVLGQGRSLSLLYKLSSS